MKSFVRIVEVGPRDGLQNEKTQIATADKIELIDRLSATGLRSIEATSFVSPKWVPQLADAAEVFAGITRKPGVRYPVLVPNEQGYDRARAVGVEEIAVFTAASEAFNQKNINASIDESIERFRPVMRARERRRRARARLRLHRARLPVPGRSAGRRRRARRAAHCTRWAATRSRSATRSASARRPRPRDAARRRAGSADAARWPCTSTTPTARRWPTSSPAWKKAWRVVDSSVSGTGGCPYAKGASGNVASEDVVYMLHGLGIETGIDLDELADTGRWLAALLGRETGSKVGKALAAS